MVLLSEQLSITDFNNQPFSNRSEIGVFTGAIVNVLTSEKPESISNDVVTLSVIPNLEGLRKALLKLQRLDSIRDLNRIAFLVELEDGQPNESVIGKVVNRLIEVCEEKDSICSASDLAEAGFHIVDAGITISFQFIFDVGRLMSKNGFSKNIDDKVYGSVFIYPDTSLSGQGSLKVNLGFVDFKKALRQEWVVNLNDFTALLAN